jgi:hypothetical protein
MTQLTSLVNPMTFATALTSRPRMLAISRTAFAVLGTWCSTLAFAQDPFGDLGTTPEVNRIDTAKGSESSIDTNETNAVVRSLRANPPTSPRELAEAIGLMTRIRRWDETARWLDKLGQEQIDGPTAVDVLRAGGPRTWAAIESNANAFKPQQLEIIGKLRKLADDEVHSPANLARQVSRLTSPNQSERLAGFHAIRSAGDSGIAAMLDALMRPNGLNPTPSMIEAYSLLGPSAVSAWQAAMTSPHSEVRDRLIQLVTPLPKPSMGSELLSILHDPTIPQETKRGVEKSLADRGKTLPDAKQAYDLSIATLDKSLDQYRQLSALNDVDTRNVWTLNQDGRGVSLRSGNGADQALARASQAAITALRTSAAGDFVSARALAAHFEDLAREGSTDLANSVVFQSLVPESLRNSHEFGALLWDAALEEQLPGAQALAVANLARYQGALMPTAVRDRLAAAMKSGHPSVRYPATVALMNSLIDQRGLIPVSKERTKQESGVDPVQFVSAPNSGGQGFRDGGFQGASRVDFNAREMQQLMADPMVMIVGASPSLRSHTHDLVSSMGLRYWEASSVEDVFNGLRNAVPFEGVFIVDHLRDLDLGQLIQRIRANPSTSTVPIALLAENLSRGEHLVAGADHGVIVGSVPPSVEGLGDILARMNQVIAYPRAAPEDRILWKNQAANYLRVAHPDIQVSEATGVTVRLADTQEEQNNLLRVASDMGQTPKQREQASQIFVQSIRRFGVLISTDTLNAQYDVYNTRGANEPVTRLVMGQILDAIDELYGRTASDPKP